MAVSSEICGMLFLLAHVELSYKVVIDGTVHGCHGDSLIKEGEIRGCPTLGFMIFRRAR